MSTDANEQENLGHTQDHVAALTTPAKERFVLGPASDYYFKYVNSSAKKGKPNDKSFISSTKSPRVGDESTVNSSAMVELDSILGIGADESDTGMISVGANSSSSSSHLMDKSTLSDTTELTAANFVLAATSRQKLNHVTKAISERTVNQAVGDSQIANFAGNVSSKSDLPVKVDKILDKENNKNFSEHVHSRKNQATPPGVLQANQGDSSSQTSLLPASLEQSYSTSKKNDVINEANEEVEILSPARNPTGSSLTSRSEEKMTSEIEKQSPESTASEDLPSHLSSTDDSIASLGEFEALFDDLPTEDVISVRRSRRKSSMPSRKSSIDRLMDIDSILKPASPTPKKGMRPSEKMSTVSEMNWQDIPTPPSPGKEGGLMFRQPPTSHRKATPTKLVGKPQRVTNTDTGTIMKDAEMEDTSLRDIELLMAGKECLQETSETLGSSPTKEASKSFLSPLRTSGLSRQSPTREQENATQMDQTRFVSAVGADVPSIRLTPNSHKKPTPTKLTKSPRRVLNPKGISSPARNTRSAKKLEGEVDGSVQLLSDSLVTNSEPSEQTASESVSSPNMGTPLSQERSSIVDNDIQPLESYHFPSDTTSIKKPLLGEVDNNVGDEKVVTNLSALLGSSSGEEQAVATSPDPMSTIGNVPSIRLTPNSHVKPTPTKIQPSPRRIPNPRATPRRLTRSSKKDAEPENDLASTGTVEELLEGLSTGKRKISDTTGSLDAIRDLMGTHEAEHISAKGRRKSSTYHPENKRSQQDQNDSLLSRSHLPSILSSKKRRITSESGGPRRFVAFGSPEAAEYHIGSPSFSLTPMPRGKAKAMFAVPRDGNQPTISALHPSSDNAETVEMEANLNELVSNMEGSPALSPIANVNERETEVIDICAGNITTNASVATNNELRTKFVVDESKAPTTHCEDVTVALEPEIENLLENVEGLPEQTSYTSQQGYQIEDHNSETQSFILSTSSKEKQPSMLDDKPSLPMDTSDSSNMDCSATREFPCQEGQMTLELEPDMNALLQATQLGSYGMEKEPKSSPNESFQLTDDQSIASMSMNSRSERDLSGSSLLMSAQKLDFRLTQPGKLDQSMEIQVGHTVELENDITGLIAVAAAATADEYKRLSMSKKEERVKHTCSTLSTTPGSGTEDGLGIDVAASNTLEPESSHCGNPRVPATGSDLLDPTQLQNTADLNNETGSLLLESVTTRGRIEHITLTSDEIAEFAGLCDIDDTSLLSPKAIDPIVQFAQSILEVNNPFVMESVGQFISAVCGEVEARTEEEIEFAAYLPSATELESCHLAKLQDSLRSSQANPHSDEFLCLVKAAKKNIQADWNKWISSVLVSFHDAIQSSSSMFDLISFWDREIEAISKSSREMASIVSLEEELEDLQSQIAVCKSKLDERQNEQRLTESIIQTMRESTVLKEDWSTIRPKAESSQKHALSLKGLHTWNALSLQEGELSFSFPGQSPDTTISLSFVLSPSTRVVNFNAQLESSYFRRNQLGSRKYSKSVLSFVETTKKRLAESRSLSSPEYVSSTLQQYEFDLGRLDLTAFELESLRRRYQVKLYWIAEEQNTFCVLAEFSKYQQKVRATFKLSHSYPSTPVEFSIELLNGSVNVATLEKALARSVKPGLWSLSRSCDAIVALLDNQN